jgi:pimeloyl-ACP methyl ester carboxylesterase
VLGHYCGGGVALTYSALFPEATSRCISAAGFAVGADVDLAEGGEAAAEMEAMLSRHQSAGWYAEARTTWDEWTERVLASDDASEVDAMMRVVMPLYTAHPERPHVWQGIEDFRQDLQFDLAAVKAWEGGLYQNVDLRPLLPNVSAPTLVIAGALDLITGPAQARRIAEGIRNVDLVLIPECGHLLAVEEPAAYKAKVTEWVARHPDANRIHGLT